MKIDAFLKQQDQFLVTSKPMVLTIDLVHYDSDSLKEKDNKIWVKSLLAKAEYEDKIFDITLDYTVELYIYKKEETKEFLTLTYDTNNIVLEVSTEASESSVQIAYIERLIGGREILKDAGHLYRKLFAVYGRLSTMDSVHLEILCSQVLRDRKNVQRPARLGRTWDPILVNIKKIILSEGFINGLAFENINEAIKSGLISDDHGDTSIIEKVMTGTLVSDDRGNRSRLGSSQYTNR